MNSSKVVIVTGTSSGLGYAIARTLAQKGHTVFATMRGVDGKNAAAATELREWAANESLTLHTLELDVTDSASVQTAVQHVVDTCGRIDVLVNNAGRGIFGLSEAFTDEQFRTLFETNVFGPMRVTQAVLPHMRSQQEGLLVYLSSATTLVAYPFMGVYGATKAALEGMAMALNSEVYSMGIDTVIIQAGSYGTEFGKNVESSAREEVWEAYGPIAGAAKGMLTGLADYFKMDMLSTPQSMGEQIADYIAMPSGQRPLKVGVGLGTDGFDVVNNAQLTLNKQANEWAGFGQFLTRA
jgi:NAD(P)-dependent dehydrogenase (short-subunit alcohol dehydrogenase family)